MSHRRDGGADIEVRSLGEPDMAALVTLVRGCYGDTYGEPGFYDVDWLAAQIRSQRLISIGACDEREVVGQMGATVPSPGDAVADTIAAMIEPGYRGQGRLHEMGRLLFETFQRRGILATRHLATGTHLRTQRPLAESGAVPTGILLGHVQAGTTYRGVPHRFGGHRIGVVVYFQRYGTLGDLDVHLPARYAHILTQLYQRTGLTRCDRSTIDAANARVDAQPTTQFAVHRNRGASTVTIQIVGTPGTRLSTDRLAAELDDCRAEVVYVDVPLTHPDCPASVDWLCGRGFLFGALLPGTADSERIRMQRMSADLVAPDAIECATADARQLRELIADELRQASARST